MTYHVIKVMAVEVPRFKELVIYKIFKNKKINEFTLHCGYPFKISNADLCYGSIVWRMFTL